MRIASRLRRSARDRRRDAHRCRRHPRRSGGDRRRAVRPRHRRGPAGGSRAHNRADRGCRATHVPFAGQAPAAGVQELSSALGWLLVGSVLAQALVNAPPIAAKLLAHSGDSAAAGQVLTARCWHGCRCSPSPPCRQPCFRGWPRNWRGATAGASTAGCRDCSLRPPCWAVATVVAATVGQRLLHLFFGDRYDLSDDILAGSRSRAASTSQP